MLIAAFFVQDVVWAYPSDSYKNLAVPGLKCETKENMVAAMLARFRRSEEALQAKIKNPNALKALLRIKGDKSLQNVYKAALYFIEEGTLGVENLLKMAVTKNGHLQEEFLGEFVEARAVESNIKYSKILELGMRVGGGAEVDFLLGFVEQTLDWEV